MACFIVPATEAVVTTVVSKILKKKGSGTDDNSLKLTDRLDRLNGLLWGGSGLLAFEHLWHGEITPFFPFLTNAVNPADRAEMFAEMSTSGVAMAVIVTAVWTVSVAVEKAVLKKSAVQEVSRI
ncbi:MAG: hypothetical protein NC340_09650 [Ruminococcus flavefaciens]|nr:hypothetical protein [Ruminococcus flavefaciens]MCM1230825.1 hypothetical protein [Ruminococcus flavefaciens]